MNCSARIRIFSLVLGAAVASGGCSLIDEDRGDCADYELDYQLQLVTNLTTELETELSLTADIAAKTALQNYLHSVFTDFAHDVDLSFYDVQGDSLRLHHEAHTMNDNQRSYSLNIPVRRYMHLAVANLDGNGVATLGHDSHCHTARFMSTPSDTLPPQRTGLFSARLPMDIREGEDQTFGVSLYMVNASFALVADTTGSHIRGLEAYGTGLAREFSVCDSLFRFDDRLVIRTEDLSTDTPGELVMASVCFPSRGQRLPAKSDEEAETLWEIHAYATLADGKVTETVLQLSEPLLAGQFRVVKVQTNPDGSLTPKQPTVGASVTLDWKQGIDDDIPLGG